MRTLLATTAAVLAATSVAALSRAPEEAPVEPGLMYPETKTVEQVDTFHGVEVSDPYRWLEDDVRVSDDVASWVETQAALADGYLKALPGRDAIEDRLTVMWNYEKFGLPSKAGDLYFFRKNDGVQNQSVLYVQDSLDGEPRTLIDPNLWSEDGATALAGTWASPDGSQLVYSIQDGGSDWRTLKIMDIATGEDLPDPIEWVKFSGVSWAKDGSGFYYGRYPQPEEGAEFQNLNLDMAVYFHEVGGEQAEDALVYSRPDNPDHGFQTAVTDDGRYLVIVVWKGTDDRYEVLVQDLTQEGSELELIVEGFTHNFSPIGNVGETMFFQTDLDAPLGRVVAVDLSLGAAPADVEWMEIIPETENTLRGVSLVGGHLIASYLKDVTTQVAVFAPDGSKVRDVELPGVGTAGGFGGEADDPETFFSFTSINTPPQQYRYDVETGEATLLKKAETPVDASQYEVNQVFYPSKDGTMVPMFIAHKKGLELDGTNPTLLYGYGGFNITIAPGFSISNMAWMEMGGVYASANIRGGGEYGKPWHDGGRLLNKQNTFDDFAAAAEFLIAEGYTAPEHIAIRGGSNGGLLVGAVLNQRPDLFAAGVPAVGVMDMVRFANFTAGRFWVDDYGRVENEDEFNALFAYSPYHNIEAEIDYPAILVTTADTDDRVVPGHSFKYAAALQAVADENDGPALIRIETRAGHGSGKPTEKIIEETADVWAFMAHHTGLNLPEGYGQ